MQRDSEGFLYPQVNATLCVNCGLCEQSCPILQTEKKQGKSKAYGGYNIDENVRLRSSSGGIFYLLAKYIIENNGVVFGAAFTESFLVEHCKIETLAEIEKLMTSKYLQSRMGNSYKEAKKYLEAGRLVLFTGTPCQIEGLRGYLRKEYANLYTQDLICHGVPSPYVWEIYLNYLGRENIQNISFREKETSWRRFLINISPIKKEKSNQNIYIRAFLSDLILRPSCYNCKFKNEHRNADITLADFWGCEESNCADMDDDKGLSLIITHSAKGEELLSNIRSNIRLRETDLLQAVRRRNPSYLHSAKLSKRRKKFFKRLEYDDFNNLVAKYTRPTFVQKIKRIAIKFLRK